MISIPINFNPDPVAIATLIFCCFIVSGIAHVFWLKLPISLLLNIPLDGGKTFRGKRIFGDNKTVRGLVIIIPVTGVNFFVIGLLLPYLPSWLVLGLWPISPVEYLIAGLIAGLGFMAGELPNSFFKRQCGIPPGAKPQRLTARIVTTVFDRLDSMFGLLLMMSLILPVPWQTWIYLLLIGPAIHSLFSFWMYRLNIKSRPG